MAPDPDLNGDDRFSAARRRMVERQIRRRGIDDERILDAVAAVPRHRFVEPRLRAHAYEDRPLPIGEDQTISQPYIVARMAQLAALRPDDRVLEIGGGSGYAAAVFSHIGREVVTVEIRPALAERARALLADLGYTNVTVISGDAGDIDPEARFDAVLTAAAADRIPGSLEDRLAEGGRLVIPVGSPYSQHLWTVRRHGEELERLRHEAVAFVPLIG